MLRPKGRHRRPRGALALAHRHPPGGPVVASPVQEAVRVVAAVEQVEVEVEVEAVRSQRTLGMEMRAIALDQALRVKRRRRARAPNKGRDNPVPRAARESNH